MLPLCELIIAERRLKKQDRALISPALKKQRHPPYGALYGSDWVITVVAQG